MYRLLFAAIALALATSGADAQSNRLNPTADFALINGKIYTMDADNPTAEAIAVEGDEIVYVGDAAGLKNEIGIGTDVIDLEGKMVLPGFVDAHTHLIGGAIVASGVNLLTDDKQELFNRLRSYVEEHPDLPFILGYGVRRGLWIDDEGIKLPTAAMIDEIEDDRPVYLWDVGGHAAWVNSKALEVAGIDKDTPDTVPGYAIFHRYEDGTPTGWIEEPPAQMQVFSPVVNPDLDFILNNTHEWLSRIAAAGVTTVQDLGFQGMTQEEGFQLFTDLAQAGELPVRMQGVYYWNDPTIDPLVPLRDLRAKFNSGLVKAGKLKANIDGADEAWNAIYVEPYNDKPEAKPDPIIPPEVLNKVFAEADAEGIDAVCHCWGDLAVRYFLDAVENAIKANPQRDRRFVVSHGSNVHPDDIPRFAELGVVYDTSGAWMANDPSLVAVSRERLGEERQQDMYPAMKIANAGGMISFGTDWPVSGYLSEYRPLMMIRTAVLRQLPGLDDRPPLGGEEARLPLELALRAATINAAYGMGYDDIVGSLEVGKKADLVVLEQDLFEVDPHDIHEVKVLYTMMNGELTYDHTNH